MSYKLICFDVDGTLVKSWTDELLPGVADKITDLASTRLALAIVTNQGGVGLRHWMRVGGFGDPDAMNLPYQNDIGTRITHLGRKLGVNNVYVAMAYQSKKTGEWSPVPESYGDGLVCGDDGFYKEHWGPQWRKPAIGMIMQAMKDNNTLPNETLMVGDSPEDEQAARAAKIDFMWADEFFGRKDA